MSEAQLSTRLPATRLPATRLPATRLQPTQHSKRPAATKPGSTRARARAQAREARQPRHSSHKTQGAAALAAQLDSGATGEPDEAKTPAQRHLEVVGERSKRRLARRHRARVLLVGAATGVVLVAFALVYLRVIAAQRQFTLDNLNGQVSSQEATYDRLRLQVAQLESPARIVGYAESKLGMVQPASVGYLTPTGGESSNAATPATQAPPGEADWPQIKALIAGAP